MGGQKPSKPPKLSPTPEVIAPIETDPIRKKYNRRGRSKNILAGKLMKSDKEPLGILRI